MAQYGVTIAGVHYYIPQQGQRKHSALYACLDGITRNAGFFGLQYENWRRIRLLDLVYEIAYSLPDGPPPADELVLDIRLSLADDTYLGFPPFGKQASAYGHVDVVVDHDVKLVGIGEALARGDVESGTMLDAYCKRYALPNILMHGRHYISPDSASVELLEDAILVGKVGSVLEIGAGVGICGVAAERHGITDYTFVDVSPTVCENLRRRFPRYNVRCGDAMSFSFDRDWDVVLIGLPYELNPILLERLGEMLSYRCGMVIFQSGCRHFFSFEHDWLMGRQDECWPWYRQEQSLDKHFRYTLEPSVDWQLAAVGCHDQTIYRNLLDRQKSRRAVEDFVLTL